ncbi:PadR family transcriptional regulator [Pyrococcus sp. ST04]|uniref:PadR family transcriptional regulator n=1 Tax=Pyrococcus sp. ST04 TaxID=1183377 RepID=UPI0002605DD6|nr:PadR family transcriptional regulator [Pyrococcus sp. ST04]AFK23141.1 transcriptional regulator, ParR family [Pyrococcus sp. ST04]
MILKRDVAKKFKRDIRAGLYAYLILLLLERKGEIHGYGIRKELEEVSGGKIVPSEGTLYDLLKRLKKYGLVEDYWAEVGGRERRYYRITDLGKSVLRELDGEILSIISIIEHVKKEN